MLIPNTLTSFQQQHMCTIAQQLGFEHWCMDYNSPRPGKGPLLVCWIQNGQLRAHYLGRRRLLHAVK